VIVAGGAVGGLVIGLLIIGLIEYRDSVSRAKTKWFACARSPFSRWCRS
jgi:hypothetical protein